MWRWPTAMPIWEKRFEMRKLLDADDPFFAATWRRWAVAVVPLVWSAVEFWSGSPFWGVLFGASGVYAAYILLIKGPSGS